MTILVFFIVISVLIFVHELGHFVAAKRSGMRVEEFGFGFPPRLWGFRRGGTVYSINCIPFGGFVKIFGEDGGHRSDTQSFGAKPLLTRLGVVVAGVTMNFLLAAVLLMAANGFGLRIGLPDAAHTGAARDIAVHVLEVAPSSPAQEAGMLVLDELVRITRPDGSIVAIKSPEQVQQFVTTHKGERLIMTVHRGAQELDLTVATRASPPVGQGPIGISMALTGVVSYPWYEAIWRGVYDAVLLTWATILGYISLIRTLLVEHRLMADVSGPVGIAKLTGQAARVGFSYLVQFVAMISINLTVLNILPFPALDGGRAVMLFIEKIKGSPVSRRLEGSINAVGFLALIALMIFITVKDITRLF